MSEKKLLPSGQVSEWVSEWVSDKHSQWSDAGLIKNTFLCDIIKAWKHSMKKNLLIIILRIILYA